MRKDRKKLSLKFKRELIRKETKYERYFRRYLEKYKYDFQKVFFTNDYEFFIVDFYLPHYKLAIELDGKQHEKNKDYDNYRTSQLKSIGVKKVLRFKNREIFDKENVEQILRLITYELSSKNKKRTINKGRKRSDI